MGEYIMRTVNKDGKGIKILELSTFGSIIKRGREHLGISLEKASQQLNISPSYLSDFENERARKIKMDFLYQCAEFYGLNVDELCISANKIPKDIYFKVLEHPHLFEKIREIKP